MRPFHPDTSRLLPKTRIGFLDVLPQFTGMCLAIPGKVLKIEGTSAKVDFGDGATRDIDVTLVKVNVGQYVLVHTGFAIQVMEPSDAEETIKIWKEILELNPKL
jgi:hydrogenase expression/formation protein HypC